MAKKILSLIYVLVAAALILPAAQARADASASFAFTPASVAVSSGAQFSVQVVIDALTPINAAQGTVDFPTNYLQVQNISEAGSIFQFWAQQPTFSNASGTITFAGMRGDPVGCGRPGHWPRG